MLARDLAEPYPYVTTDEDAAHAVRLLARHRLPALLVVDADAMPYALVPCGHLLGRLVSDGREHGVVPTRVDGLTVADWLPPAASGPPTVEESASLTQIADVMTRTHSPLVAVVERDGHQLWLAGVVTAARLMERLVGGEA
ncbi:CBS domain-containing protein [Streptomyces neyagawaensis]|uniref:CBS domain-containing protein n=1 Tax=Streptomyces neyagawaensis TaxID=42238 RepID=UPI0006E2FD97|nr:CBS domain-containing protein [Streptomyces neyagawaensis]MCL6738512.1 CBS domain-containing protein [Streptomyces neyagawaensis]MDE1688661.1 CBS domain-containing protein [Streptomyces neyagawaensis]